MKLITLLLGFTLGVLPVTAIAGSGHDHGHGHSHAAVDQDVAKLKAKEAVTRLIKKNKINDSWKTINASTVEKKIFNGKSEWVVVFVNKKITSVDKQKLHVFLTMSGDYIAANFSGK